MSKTVNGLRIFQNAINFSSIELREYAIQRNKIISVPITTEISELRDKFLEFGLDLTESEDYETIAGFILYHTGSFPKEGSEIVIKDKDKSLKFKILKIQDTKIEKIMLYDI